MSEKIKVEEKYTTLNEGTTNYKLITNQRINSREEAAGGSGRRRAAEI